MYFPVCSGFRSISSASSSSDWCCSLPDGSSLDELLSLLFSFCCIGVGWIRVFLSCLISYFVLLRNCHSGRPCSTCVLTFIQKEGISNLFVFCFSGSFKESARAVSEGRGGGWGGVGDGGPGCSLYLIQR